MNEGDLLQKIGLTPKEAQTYTTLLKQGGLNYSQLAATTKINRTTCYSVVKSLIQKDLVTEDLGSPIVRIIPKHPTILLDTLQKEQASLNRKLELTKRTVQELDKLVPGKRVSEPRLTYIGESDITDFLYKRTEKWIESAKLFDSTVWGFESDRFEVDYPEWIQWYWTRPVSEGISLNLFSDGSTARKKAIENSPGKAEFQFIPDLDFTTDIWIYGDYVVLLSLEDHPHYLIELKEPLLAKNFRGFFKSLWKATEHTWEKASKNNLGSPALASQ